MLGSEYDYVPDVLVLRISGRAKPSQAKAYESAFGPEASVIQGGTGSSCCDVTFTSCISADTTVSNTEPSGGSADDPRLIACCM